MSLKGYLGKVCKVFIYIRRTYLKYLYYYWLRGTISYKVKTKSDPMAQIVSRSSKYVPHRLEQLNTRDPMEIMFF